MRIIVTHQTYGCESGCCGHVVEVDNAQVGPFQFTHPYGGSTPEYVRDLVTKMCGEDHVKDIDWDHCLVSDD